MKKPKHFYNVDMNACRQWLRSRGLEIDGTKGWKGPGTIGTLTFDKQRGEWQATVSEHNWDART